jgi:hypothetical protein
MANAGVDLMIFMIFYFKDSKLAMIANAVSSSTQRTYIGKAGNEGAMKLSARGFN